jgi:WD40 repeat protein
MVFDCNDEYILFACKKSLVLLPAREEHAVPITIDNWAGNYFRLLSLATMPGAIVAGLQSGQLIKFGLTQIQGNKADIYSTEKSRHSYAFSTLLSDSHRGPCGAIWKRKHDAGFLSGGYDGSVLIWNLHCNLEKKIILKDILQRPLSSYKIKSVGEDHISGVVFIGTKAGDIVQYLPSKNEGSIIMKGHLDDILDLDTLGQNKEVATLGLGRELIIWNVESRREKSVITLEFEAHKVAGSFDGKHVAVGFPSGSIQIIEVENEVVINRIRDCSLPVTLLKYSRTGSDNSVLAAAWENSVINFYRVRPQYQLLCSASLGRAQILRSLDFSERGDKARLFTHDFEVKYVELSKRDLGKQSGDIKDANSHVDAMVFRNEGQPLDPRGQDKKKKMTPATSIHLQMKDQNWATWTTLFGWEITGLIQDIRVVRSITCVERSQDSKMVAVGMDSGVVRFYGFPCLGQSPQYVEVAAHVSEVTKIIFVVNSDMAISIAGKDKSMVQWRVRPDFIEKLKTESNELEAVEQYLEGLKEPPSIPELKDRPIFPAEQALTQVKKYKFPKMLKEPPEFDLRLRHVFGCKFGGAMNFAKFSVTETVVYFLSNKAIVQEHDHMKTQSFFTLHSSPILAMDVDRQRELVATGDWANHENYGNIYVWHYKSKRVIAKMKASGTHGVVFVKFSPDGSKLLAVSNDPCHTLDIFDFRNAALITSVKTGSRAVIDIAFKSEDEFVTLTSTAPFFWKLNGCLLTLVRADWGSFVVHQDQSGKHQPDIDEDFKEKAIRQARLPDLLTCCTFGYSADMLLTANDKGNVYVWLNKVYNYQAMADAKAESSNAIRAMTMFKNVLYTGDDTGLIRTWKLDKQIVPDRLIQFFQDDALGAGLGIRSLDITADELFLIGTADARIVVCQQKMSQSSAQEGANSKAVTMTRERRVNFAEVSESHAAKSILAFACSPTAPVFVTGADDGSLVLWDASLNSGTEADADLMKKVDGLVVALDWSFDGKVIAAGSSKGILYLFDNSLRKVIGSSESLERQITAIKIFHSPLKLAVTTTDSTYKLKIIDVKKDRKSGGFAFDMPKAKNIALPDTCRTLDWSTDGDLLICTLDRRELVYVDAVHGQVTQHDFAKDKRWLTWTQPLGMSVRGIKIDHSCEVKYTPVCRSHKYVARAMDYTIQPEFQTLHQFVVTGDTFGNVKMHRYPVVSKDAESIEWNALAQPITWLGVGCSDQFVYALGQYDNSIAVFEVVSTSAEQKRQRDGRSDDSSDIHEAKLIKLTDDIEEASERSEIDDQQGLFLVGSDGLTTIYKDYADVQGKIRFTRPWMASVRCPYRLHQAADQCCVSS